MNIHCHPEGDERCRQPAQPPCPRSRRRRALPRGSQPWSKSCRTPIPLWQLQRLVGAAGGHDAALERIASRGRW